MSDGKAVECKWDGRGELAICKIKMVRKCLTVRSGSLDKDMNMWGKKALGNGSKCSDPKIRACPVF